MGSSKALLCDGSGLPYVARVVRTFNDAGLMDVTVVAGAQHEAVRRALEESAAGSWRVVRNPDPDRGQVSSIWTGMDAAVGADTQAIVLTLVDVPYVTSGTVRAVIQAYEQSRAGIVRPAIGDQHGHPVIFDRTLFDALRRVDPAVGAKAVVREYASAILNVPVEDRGALRDVDTPADYAAALRAEREPTPDPLTEL